MSVAAADDAFKVFFEFFAGVVFFVLAAEPVPLAEFLDIVGHLHASVGVHGFALGILLGVAAPLPLVFFRYRARAGRLVILRRGIIRVFDFVEQSILGVFIVRCGIVLMRYEAICQGLLELFVDFFALGVQLGAFWGIALRATLGVIHACKVSLRRARGD